MCHESTFQNKLSSLFRLEDNWSLDETESDVARNRKGS